LSFDDRKANERGKRIMPKFGVCTSPDHSQAVRAAGYDYIEASTQALFQGTHSDEQWDGPRLHAQSVLPVLACNVLAPGSLKITGPEVNAEAIRSYMTNVLKRADKLNVRTLVFGSGAARKVPDGFDRDKARRQILDFSRMSAQIAGQHNVTIVYEPLNRGECNIINTVGEAMEYVREVNHPNMQCLVDSYHFWLEDEPLSNLQSAMKHIRHVHVADKDGRVGPGVSGTSDYVPFFRVLKQGGYDGPISIEGKFEATVDGEKCLAVMKEAWERA
jgi:sugar phosphate isomerase/epimerase